MQIRELSLATVAREVGRLRPPEESSLAVTRTVADLIADVRRRGDDALVEATARFDWPGCSVAGLRVAPDDLRNALRHAPPSLQEALRVARENLTWFHEHERRLGWDDEGRYGQRLGIRYLPVRRAGLYVPGGLGSYASTVIMNAVPALVAGVRELFVCTPPGRNGEVNESVLAAAALMGIAEVYRVGGAQAVAAMAYGTASIPRADVICGPGNAYVMEAKRLVYGAVGIDGLAGPSEVVVVAGDGADPEWVGADLLAQEEHGSGAQAVVVASNEGFCRAVDEALLGLRRRMGGRKEPEPTQAAGLYAFYPTAGEDFLPLALSFVNTYAPEHLELHLADARAFADSVTAAGAIFVGALTPTAFGDYVAGSNHVLPTGGSARFSSPLSVDTFVTKTSVCELEPHSVRMLTPHLAELAESEGFAFHRLSAELRADGKMSASASPPPAADSPPPAP
jgi:histidinol dehydrogenase